MQQLARFATEKDIIAAVEDWVRELARGDYPSAFAHIEHDPSFRWTAELLQSTINGYGLPEPHPRGPFEVTDPLTARGDRWVEFDRPPGGPLQVRYNLPLNGEWSDLTATFRVEPRGETSVLVLEEVHVF